MWEVVSSAVTDVHTDIAEVVAEGLSCMLCEQLFIHANISSVAPDDTSCQNLLKRRHQLLYMFAGTCYAGDWK